MASDPEGEDFFNISGTKLNTSRPFTAPLPFRHRPQAEEMIDLYNFEDPKFEDSRYVMTSPRSLEACSRLGIKPVELLYKPLAEFQDDLLPQNVPLRTIYNMFDEHEVERQRKLRLCRDELQLLEEDEGWKSRQSPRVITSARDRVTSPRTAVRKSKILQFSGSDTDEAEEFNHPSSLQRRRTAWTTSLGHERLTKDEINERRKRLHEEAKVLRTSYSAGAGYGDGALGRMTQLATSRRGKERRKSYRERSQSLSDIGYHTGASALLRVPNKNARPISDSHLRKKLQGKKNVRLPEKDQRILELMMSKHEEEAYQNQLQRDAKLSWDEQRRAEKQTTENQRRHSMTKPSNGRLRRSNSAIQHSNRYQADCALQAEQLAKLKEEELALKMDRKQYLEFKQKQWEELHRKQQEAKAQKVMEKKKKELERKRSVERALQLKEQEEEEYREQMKKKLENNLKRANSKKESKEQKELMQRKVANAVIKRRQEQRKSQIDELKREDLEDLKASIEYKHAVAEENLQKVEEEKELQLRMSHHEREKKMAKTRRSLMEQEIEMAMWRKELGEHRKEIEEKAAEVAHMTVEQKARRAQEERIAKEKEHRRNLQRLKKDEEAWKEEMKAQIAVKEFKSKLIQQEKDQTIEESRAIAAQSQQLRDDIRRSYNADSFDKKAKQVALQNRTLGVQGATKNMSSLSLG
ncbi:coiled-coil domain-containing protein 177 isoform X4 [Lingula anatina]|uniref:Coiled-coil domain-containing protein 177 isoform X4 n=1 Tax=Lingula anatina TaxID=7574 RepID=A0A1S3IKP8_LINAN|nr:coiled-coil domain-containing protein 177 isoform X4 [Lingula anatina]|eukprot:XP_013398820.1 coiled-coil domain-containing protein 177 isoform X4 [Lingula anatina]